MTAASFNPDRIHVVVIPVYGFLDTDFQDYCENLGKAGFNLILVDNNEVSDPQLQAVKAGFLLLNANRGGVAGGFNRGVEHALLLQADWVTLLDQDSRIDSKGLHRLADLLEATPAGGVIVGPCIWDQRRRAIHGRIQKQASVEWPTRLLISSGTTFRLSEWKSLGEFDENLHIDFVDHAWCFRAQSQGFKLVQHSQVLLYQTFGRRHPNPFCHMLGMELYSPIRHFYAIRNLRWLCLQPFVPLDLKIKELVKMAIKPWLWILFEPQRLANLRAVLGALTAPLLGATPHDLHV